jgi:hypothetical protein
LFLQQPLPSYNIQKAILHLGKLKFYTAAQTRRLSGVLGFAHSISIHVVCYLNTTLEATNTTRNMSGNKPTVDAKPNMQNLNSGHCFGWRCGWILTATSSKVRALMLTMF